MTFDQFRRAGEDELLRAAKECINTANDSRTENDRQVSYLLEAQFYMQELDRRDGTRIARRDLALEPIVITLIFGEIASGVSGIAVGRQDGEEQASLLSRQADTLGHLDSNIASTASTIQEVAGTIKTMNKEFTDSSPLRPERTFTLR